MNVGLKEIADQAGVSVATVSLVLNGKPGVSIETRERVLQIAADVNYNPRGKKNARGKDAGTIKFLKIVKHGHILNEDHRVFIADYMDGLSNGAKHFGYNLLVSSFQSADIPGILGSIDLSPVTGMAVLGTELEEDDFTCFSEIKIPIVFIDVFHDFYPYNFIDMDNPEAVFKIVSHFYHMGHPNIGFVGGTPVTRNFSLRERGFVDALKYYQIPVNRDWFFYVDSTFGGAYTDFKKILGKGPELPGALFVANDIIAFGCMRALKESGYSIPDDISVIAFDDLPASAMTDPPLTSIRVSKKQIGEMAIQILHRHIGNEENTHSAKVIISSELVTRHSVLNLNRKE